MFFLSICVILLGMSGGILALVIRRLIDAERVRTITRAAQMAELERRLFEIEKTDPCMVLYRVGELEEELAAAVDNNTRQDDCLEVLSTEVADLSKVVKAPAITAAASRKHKRKAG
jgi:hypothetical protein